VPEYQASTTHERRLLLPCDLAMAGAFVGVLAPDSSVTFQTFDDTAAKRPLLGRIFHGSLEERAAALTRFNSKGAGIFVMVNVGDGTGRAKKNVLAVRALFVDLDGCPLPDRRVLLPHLLVESSPGRHQIFWLVQNVLLHEFGIMQEALANHYSGDPTVKDLPRVMRVPGFYHHKRDPVMVRLLEARDVPPYSRHEVLAAWPFLQKALQPKAHLTSASLALSTEGNRSRRYALAALQKELDAVASAPKGTRNNTLNRAAFSLGRFVRAGLLELLEVEDVLAAGAGSSGLGEAEVRRTIRSGLCAGMEALCSLGKVPPPEPLTAHQRERARFARWSR
jgi:putative DNA primase/helicase